MMIMLVEGSRLVSTNQQGGRHQCRSPNTHFTWSGGWGEGGQNVPYLPIWEGQNEVGDIQKMAREKCAVQIPTWLSEEDEERVDKVSLNPFWEENPFQLQCALILRKQPYMQRHRRHNDPWSILTKIFIKISDPGGVFIIIINYDQDQNIRFHWSVFAPISV